MVEKQNNRQSTRNSDKWRSIVLEKSTFRLIKIILFLTAGNTALRGNEDSNKKENITEGNFYKDS